MKRRLLNILLAAVIMLTGCSSRPEKGIPPEAEQLAVTVIDVGKGDCILIQLGGKSILIDTGYAQTANEVMAFIERNSVGSIDYMVITHYDKDHVGGAAGIVREMDVGQIYLPNYEGSSEFYHSFIDAVRDKGLTPENVSEDVTLNIGEAELTIFATAVEYRKEGKEWNDNDVSLVTALRYKEDSYLFTGDIEKTGIKGYLNAREGQYDVIKMPHHGKSFKNLDKLIDSVEPQYALITDGVEAPADNETLELLREEGIPYYRSSKHGTYRITSSGQGEYAIATYVQ